jgi:hypothetical protein
MSTLDDIRKNLKAGKPHVVTSLATPSSSKTDPLAAIRNKVKGSKPTSSPKPATPAAPRARTQTEIENIFKNNEGVNTQVALTAVYKAGYADGQASRPSI